MPPSEASVPDGEWLAYGRTRGGSHYSPLADIKLIYEDSDYVIAHTSELKEKVQDIMMDM